MTEATIATLPTRWATRPVRDADTAVAFIVDCVDAIGGGWHPDTRFSDYVNTAAGIETFTSDAAELLDRRTDETFALLGGRVYEIGLDLLHSAEDPS